MSAQQWWAKTHPLPTREPAEGGIQMTAFPRLWFQGQGMDSGKGHLPTTACWTQAQADSLEQRLMQASLDR